MKKWMKTLLLGAAFTVLLCTSALAADKGIVTDMTGTGVTLTAQKADGTAATEETAGEKTVYADAERIGMTLDTTESGTEYLVFVLEGTETTPTADNIVYIDQKSGEAAGTFDLYPSSLSNGPYSICMSTSNPTNGTIQKVGSFEYYAAYTLGDVDDNGTINTRDVSAVLLHGVKKKMLTGSALLAADVDKNDVVNARDASRILLYAVQKITSFS